MWDQNIKLFKKKKALSNFLNHPVGSTSWLISTEINYGGRVSNIKRNKVSELDPRTKEELSKGGMVGGDRMLDHNYAKIYSKYLSPYINRGFITLTEIGILKGTGLAIWCDLFTKGRIIGFDIDLSHIKENLSNLENLGAFQKNHPELYEFDQFLDNSSYIGSILKNNKIDICIDDGLHSDTSILKTMESIMPHLADEFIYFVEDNKTIHIKIREKYPYLITRSFGEMTVISNKS